MHESRIQIEEGGHLTLLEMASDVAVTGWDEGDVLIRLPDGLEQDLTIEETEQGPAVSAQVATEVWVPSNVPVTVRQSLANLQVKDVADLNAEQVRGNLKLEDISKAAVAEVYGNLKADTTAALRLVGTVYGDADLGGVPHVDLQNIRGNLRLKASDSVRVSRIGGNLYAKEVSGTLDADQVGGNAILKGVGGACNLDRVAGNLIAKNVTGGAKATRIGGNLVLNGAVGTGRSYHFKADGNGLLRLAEDASAHLTLSAKGNLVTSVSLADQVRDGNVLSAKVGDGGTEIAIEAKGNIVVSGGEASFGAELGEEISRQVEESLRAIDLEAIGRQVSEEMETALSRLRVKLEGVDWARLGLKTQETIEQAMDRMQRDLERWSEKAARHQERVERKAEQHARRAERMEQRLQRAAQRLQEEESEVEAEEFYEAPEPGPDLDEERLSILRMVEQGQISPEEAEMLLDALG